MTVFNLAPVCSIQCSRLLHHNNCSPISQMNLFGIYVFYILVGWNNWHLKKSTRFALNGSVECIKINISFTTLRNDDWIKYIFINMQFNLYLKNNVRFENRVSISYWQFQKHYNRLLFSLIKIRFQKSILELLTSKIPFFSNGFIFDDYVMRFLS